MIKATDIHKSFGNNAVLKGVNLEVDAGAVVCLLGASGSGKSTFLRCLNLLETPDAGGLSINGIEVSIGKTNVNRLRQNLGMVFQNFNLFPHISVIDNITLGPIRLSKVERAAAEEEANVLLRRVGLDHKAGARPLQLSGGEKQRVAIARALAMKPKAILFDEPTSSLDPEMVKEVLEVMRDLANSGMTMIVVTHEMGFAREVADRVAFMHAGTVVENAPPVEFFSSPTHPRAAEFLSKVL